MNTTQFNENEWLKLLYLLADTQTWIDNMVKDAMHQLPLEKRKQLFSQTYYLSTQSLVHILERHYHKIPRHPASGKFTIPLVDILHWVRLAFHEPEMPQRHQPTFFRILNTQQTIGYDKHNQPTTWLTVITETTGQIKTAFPGKMDTL